MKKKIALALTVFCALNNSAYANTSDCVLKQAREKVIKQYVTDLQKADYKDITQLFEKDGFVISTGAGKVNAKDFFYSFLSNVISANTEFHQVFADNENRLAARFHFSFKFKDGDAGDGEYMDEYVFSPSSKKLAEVYMFENLKKVDG